MSSIRSLVVHFVAVASAVAMLTVIAASSALADETKTFTGLKICKPPGVPIQFVPPAPGGYCLITASSLKILLGAKVYLTNATLVAGVLDSPVTLKAIDRRGSTATGHCTYYRLRHTRLDTASARIGAGPISWRGSTPRRWPGRPRAWEFRSRERTGSIATTMVTTKTTATDPQA
jgi:hypothetical protein